MLPSVKSRKRIVRSFSGTAVNSGGSGANLYGHVSNSGTFKVNNQVTPSEASTKSHVYHYNKFAYRDKLRKSNDSESESGPMFKRNGE